MADLYTSLIRAKQELNDGVLPPMTPIPENVQHFIDPEFTPGLGALEADAEKGLRCPVVGCGRWMHSLKRHLNYTHRDIGGTMAVIRALSIPETAPLASERLRGALREHVEKRKRETGSYGLPTSGNMTTSLRERTVKARRKASRTVNNRNHIDACDPQIGGRLWDLHNRLGRTPTERDARALDPSLGSVCRRLYGSWNNAKGQHGLDGLVGRGNTYRTRYSKETVLYALSEFYAAHGRLPSSAEAGRPRHTPLIPPRTTVLDRLGCGSWGEAMTRAAKLLALPRDTRTGKGYTPGRVFEMLSDFYATHGHLPTYRQCNSSARTPCVPTPGTVFLHLHTTSWPDAMRQVAEHLDIYDDRYRPEPADAT